jgi:hypothetical protein
MNGRLSAPPAASPGWGSGRVLHQYPYILFYPISIQQEGFCMNVIGLTANHGGTDSNTLRTVRDIRKWFAYGYDRYIQRGWMK